MVKQMELSDYQLWMCKQIQEKIDEHVLGFPDEYNHLSNREVITIALNEMLLRLDGYDHTARKIE